MASNVIIVDREYAAEVLHLNEGILEFKDIVDEYKIILDELTKEGIVDKSINNVMVEKTNRLNEAIYKVEQVVSTVFRLTVDFMELVEEKDKFKK